MPPELDALTTKCLQKRPQDRYPTGATLLAAVETLQKQMESHAAEKLITPVPVEVLSPTPAEELAVLAKEMLEAGQVDEVVAWLDKVMQRISTSPHLLLVYAEAAKRAGKLDAARAVYQRIVRWMKGHGFGDEELRHPSEGLAELNIRLKKYEEAVQGFSWLSECWPENRWYRYRLGIAFGLSGRYRNSLEVLQYIYSQGPASAVVCAKIGLAYLQLNDIEQACQYFNEALMLDQFESTALFQLARIRAIQGKTDRAMTYLNRLELIEGAGDQAQELARLLGKRC